MGTPSVHNVWENDEAVANKTMDSLGYRFAEMGGVCLWDDDWGLYSRMGVDQPLASDGPVRPVSYPAGLRVLVQKGLTQSPFRTSCLLSMPGSIESRATSF